MSSTGPYLLVPTKITDAMLTSSTIAEPDTGRGEEAWTSAAAYTVADEVVDSTTHAIYSCVKDHTGRTVVPSADPLFWLYKQPSNKWAVFDSVIDTASIGATPLTMVLRPGFFNALTLYGLDGTGIVVSVKDAPGGTVIYRFPGGVGSTDVYLLQDPPFDWYDWAFGQIRPLEKLVLSGIVPYPDAELTITITAGAGNVSVGMVNIGDLRNLLDGYAFGSAEQGATAEPVSYAYIDTDQWGNTVVIDGPTATDIDVSVFMPREAADQVLAIIQNVLGTPVSWVTTTAPGHDGLNTFGLTKGKLNYEAGYARFRINVKGLI